MGVVAPASTLVYMCIGEYVHVRAVSVRVSICVRVQVCISVCAYACMRLNAYLHEAP